MIIDHAKMMNALELLSFGKRFKVTKQDPDDDFEYEVEDSESDIVAFVDGNGNVEYTVSMMHRPGCYYAKIDMGSLDAMRRFLDSIDGMK